MSTDDAKRRMAASDEILTNRIREFTRDWCPQDSEGGHRFRRDLMTLLISALENRSEARRYGLELYAGSALEQMALRPLAAVMERDQAPKPCPRPDDVEWQP